MSEHIDRLCGELRIKLHGIDRRLEALKANAMATSEKSQHAVESQLDRVEQRIYDNRIVVEAANARVKAWFDGKKTGFDAGRASWMENRQVHLLNTRADDAEAYAGAVFDGSAAADEARKRRSKRSWPATMRTGRRCRRSGRDRLRAWRTMIWSDVLRASISRSAAQLRIKGRLPWSDILSF